MKRKPKKIDKIAAKFTVKTLPTIKRGTYYEGSNKIMQLLYVNTEILSTPQGGGHHGHIGIIMKTALYTILMTMEWTNPADPGVYSAIPPNATAVYQDQLHIQHDELQRI